MDLEVLCMLGFRPNTSYDSRFTRIIATGNIDYEQWMTMMLLSDFNMIPEELVLAAQLCLKLDTIVDKHDKFRYIFHFSMAVKQKRYELARLMIQQPGFDKLFSENFVNIETRESVLQVLARQMTEAEIDILDGLLNTGIDINSDRTVLFTALYHSNYYAFQAFVERGSNLFVKLYDMQILVRKTLWRDAKNYENKCYRRILQYVDNNIKQRLNLRQLCWLTIRTNAIEFNALPPYIITDCKTSLANDFSEIDEEHMDECAPPLLKLVYTLAQETNRQKRDIKIE